MKIRELSVRLDACDHAGDDVVTAEHGAKDFQDRLPSELRQLAFARVVPGSVFRVLSSTTRNTEPRTRNKNCEKANFAILYYCPKMLLYCRATLP